jgi:hypothetical protein
MIEVKFGIFQIVQLRWVYRYLDGRPDLSDLNPHLARTLWGTGALGAFQEFAEIWWDLKVASGAVPNRSICRGLSRLYNSQLSRSVV